MRTRPEPPTRPGYTPARTDAEALRPSRASRHKSPAMPLAPPMPSAETVAVARRSARTWLPAADGPAVTVVVCTRNRAEGLRNALRSLSGLNVDGLWAEVLVIDNGSSDHTAEVVKDAARISPFPVRRVHEPKPGVANARQRGVEEAGGEWVAFFDDDQLAHPGWLKSLLALAEAKDAKFVGGRVVLALPAGHAHRRLAPFTEMLLGASVRMTTARPYDRKTTPGAGNMMVRREVFEAVGPFDPTLDRGEDTDFYMRAVEAGFDAWYAPDAVVEHVIPAERMGDGYLYRLCDVIGNGTAERDYERLGRANLPAIWTARLGQAALTLGPKWVWAKLIGDAEGERGRRCRLRVAKRYLSDGLRYMTGRPVTPPV